MSCTENNKTIAHHFICNGWALALQVVIAAAGYILLATKLDTEKPYLLECESGANPLDVYFDIDPDHSPEAHASCEYSCVGGDLSIISPIESSSHSPENVIESVMTATDAHLQDKVKLKLMQRAKKGTVTGTVVDRDRAIGELLLKMIMLYPMVIDPHGRFGPLLVRFLFGTMPQHPCPLTVTEPMRLIAPTWLKCIGVL